MDWLWEDRLVEVWAAPGRAGSGVAFGAAGVLTAGHVVAEGSPVRVLARIVHRTDLDSAGPAAAPWVPMRVVATDPDWDLAVLEVNPDDPDAGRWRAPASAEPRVAALSGAVEPACETVGFPDASVQGRARGRPGDRVRQSEQAVGKLLPMGLVKSSGDAFSMSAQVMPLDVVTATPEQAANWGGMSGAGVVLADGRLAGMVVGVEPDRQARRLLVVPLAAALASAPPLREALESVSGDQLVIEPRQASGGRRLSAADFIEQFVIDHLTFRRRELPIPFGGRDDELDRLNRWAQDPVGPPCFVVSAPPGRGKSTLLTRWWQQYHDGPAVFVPISLRYGVAKEEDVLRALVARLAEAHGDDRAEAPGRESAGELRDRLAGYLRMAAPAGRHLVIVVDGIDEAMGWDPSDSFPWPQRFGPGVRLLVAARQTQDRSNAASWCDHLGWADDEAATMDLAALTERGIGQVLDSLRPSLTAAQAAVRSLLFDLTGGDPLVVRLYLEDLVDAPDRDAWISALGGTGRPPGLGGYLRQWMADQVRLWGGDLGTRPRDVGAVFSLLACAFAPLRRDHLLRLAERCGVADGDALNAALAELRRFVITDKTAETRTYVLSHPRIAEQRRDHLAEDKALARYDMIFADHYRSQLPDWTEADWLAIDDYGLRHLTAHLRRAGRPDLLHALLRRERPVGGRPQNGWHHAKASAGQFGDYLADVQEAWQLAGDFAEQARYALYAASVWAHTANVPGRLPELCVRYGALSWPQAVDMARAQLEPSTRAKAIACLLPLIPPAAQEEVTRAELAIAGQDREGVLRQLAAVAPGALAGEVLAITETLGNGHLRAGIVVGLAARLANEDIRAAVRVARSVDDPLNRVRALAAIAARVPDPLRGDLLTEITDMIDTMPDDYKKGLALCALAQVAPDRETIARDVLALAEQLDDPYGLPEVLTALAQLEPDERLLTDALDLAERIYQDEDREVTDLWYMRALIGVGPRLSPARRAERAGKLIDQMLGYTGFFNEINASEDVPLLAPLLLPEQRRETLAGRIGTAVGIAGSASSAPSWEYAAALEVLTDLPPPQLEAALSAADRVADHDRRADILAVLLTQLDEDRRRLILGAELARVQAIHDEPDQAYALAALVPQLSEPERIHVAERAVEIAGPLLRDAKHAELIGSLAPHLLDDALDAVRRMKDGFHGDRVLAALVAVLPEAKLAAVEEMAANKYLVTAALAARQRRVADEVLRQVGSTNAVELPDEFLFVLGRVAPQLSSSGQAAALTLVEDIRPYHPKQAARALALLAPHLSSAAERDAALAIAGRLDGAPYVTAASALADGPHSDTVRRARAVADGLLDYDRADAMAALARFPEDRPAALAAALAVRDDLRRGEILARVAPHLDPPGRGQALAAMLRCYAAPPNSYFHVAALRATLLTRIAETTALTGGSAAPAVARAILDTARWWP